MSKDAVTPTLITVIFILFTGLYGFVKFSYEKAHVDIAHVVIPTTAEINPPALFVPPLVDGDGIGLKKSARPLFTYVYTESLSARVNLIFFLSNGLHDAADFIFILNGPTNVATLIPNRSNIQVVSRSTECSDLTVHDEILRKDGLWKKYNRFIMLSAAVRGPFVPFWSRSCWSDVFLDRITEDVKLVGMKATCLPKFHIESMILATDTIGMELLLDQPKGSSVPYTLDDHRNQVVVSGEHLSNTKQNIRGGVEATGIIKSAGYKVDIVIPSFAKIEDYEENCAVDSVEDMTFGQQDNIHPYEAVFIKTNLDTDSDTVARLTEWHQSRIMNGSWDACHRDS
ncbi:uncharacterized protein GGS22DRAFT_109434 [Annulohypoxylon maeteangense]|uniref:uncharacterized protein n=1 Tax=Annulohypoxylon maeteangense TaxID=1927788 RepID=UPI002007F017|nr:uncharacterized protein GGS22DRAFT_109434 [Annulohypoxylon maeteangense]KAI0887429.1 hypothetical protein GGS22DRAFT_109434 [Annulohypoxylon maeteangense]